MMHCNASYQVLVSVWEQVPKALVKKAWIAGNYVPFDNLHNQHSHELMSSEITNYDVYKIIKVITQVANYEDFLQHYLAADNTYVDSKFCNSNVFD